MTRREAVVPPHFVVFIPGFMGSRLRIRGQDPDQVVWVPSLPLNPLSWGERLDWMLKALAYPNEELEPAGVIDQVVFIPPWAKQEHYGRLLKALQEMGYQVDPAPNAGSGPAAFTFAYDWRQDNRISARQLAEAVAGWRERYPGAQAWIIAHSNGGLVARWYIEKLGGKEHVGRLFLMGSPWDGAPKIMAVLYSGLEALLRRRFNLFGIAERTRDLWRTFPCSYQLLPHRDPFLREAHNELVDLFTGDGWLENPGQRELLADGHRFGEELGTANSVDTYCFFGRRKPTHTAGRVSFTAGNRWSAVEWDRVEAGDGTVPERSAVHPTAGTKLPFAAGHGDIYVLPSVLEFLKWHLVDEFRAVSTRAALTTERLRIVFNPERDIYSPGEPIGLWATVHGEKDGSPVTKASIQVELRWRDPLPGGSPTEAPPDLPSTRLRPSRETPGRYEGVLIAPSAEGYYRLEATVKAPNERAVLLEELLAIEGAGEVG